MARTAAFACISLLLGLLVAEGLVRAFAAFGGELGAEIARRDPLDTLRVPHGDFGYRQRPNASQTYGNGAVATSNVRGYRGPVVPTRKEPGSYRILLLGGSATHGWGVNDDETIDAHLRALLAERAPGQRFEVVNLALDGYDSYQVFERMRSDGLALEPDLVIVNSGVNDVRNARIPDLDNPDPRALLWRAPMARMRAEAERGGPAPWTRIKHYLYIARIPALLRERMRPPTRTRTEDAVAPDSPVPDHFVTNLSRTADLADGVGAAVIFSTPPSALATLHAPSDTSTRSYWVVDAATTQDIRTTLATRMAQLATRLAREGRPVRYLAVDLEPELFLDDCHLTSEGNRALAEVFAAEVEATRRDTAGRRSPPAAEGPTPAG